MRAPRRSACYTTSRVRGPIPHHKRLCIRTRWGARPASTSCMRVRIVLPCVHHRTASGVHDRINTNRRTDYRRARSHSLLAHNIARPR